MAEASQAELSVWSHLNLRKLLPPIITFAAGAAMSRYKEQGAFTWFPDWGFDLSLIITAIFGVYWLWTQPDIRSLFQPDL